MKGTGRGHKGVEPSSYRTRSPEGEPWSGQIDRLAWGGLGLAREEDGRLVLLRAPLALFPGEKVEAKVHWKARHGEGRVISWTRRDPRRRTPACPVADLCGGCDLQGAGHAAGDLKRLMVEDLLARQLPEQPWRWIPAPEGTFRHRIQVHWSGQSLGFHRRGSHQMVAVKECPTASPHLSAALPRMLEAIQARRLPTRPQRWELVVGAGSDRVFAVDEGGKAWELEPDGWHSTQEPVVQSFEGFRLRHRPGGFFQVCTPWAVKTFGEILEGWDLKGSILFDLFGGVGLFSALLGQRFLERVLVEGDEAAVTWARRNLEALELPSQCHASDVTDWVSEGLGTPQDLILLDPPRAGLDEALSTKLLSAQTAQMVLVGCDGAAFCRDLKRLSSAWKVKDLVAMDLFPLTVHAEFIALLEKV